jgi:glycosyltransferase involved in cell wall biosynthesis
MMKIGFIQHFPNSPAGENETLLRFAEAARLAGYESEVIPVSKGSLGGKQIQYLDSEIDVLIDIHFTYPRFLKPYSIGLVWTPIGYMADWGLPGVLPNLLSHSALVSTSDNPAIKLFNRFRKHIAKSALSNLPINHSIPSSWMVSGKPDRDWNNAKLFYVGINWDKLSNSKGRHDSALKSLDKEGLLTVYGPKKLFHVQPWAGYSGYRGEIPFDGRSILSLANLAGVYLVWSSTGHIKENIMSNRLFEAMASDCIVIGDGHPAVKEILGDLAFYVNTNASSDVLVAEVNEILEFIKNHPDEMNARLEAQREIFRNQFSLERQLQRVIEAIPNQNPRLRQLEIIVLGNQEEFLSRNNWISNKQNIIYIETLSDDTKVSIFDLIEKHARNSRSEFSFFVTAETELFRDAFNLIEEILDDGKNFNLAFTTGISIFDRAGLFSPDVVTVHQVSSYPLNGLISNNFSLVNHPILNAFESNWKKVTIKNYPEAIWRVASPSSVVSLPIVNNVQVIYTVLEETMNALTMGSSESARITLDKYFHTSEHTNIANLVAALPSNERNRINLALLSSIPGMKFPKILFRFLVRMNAKLLRR